MSAGKTPVTEADRGGLAAEVAQLKAQLASEGAAARAEQARLTFELGHRVKNTLSVVQALTSQTLRGTTAPEALEAFGDRILALARANDAILCEGWTSLTIEATARCVLRAHAEAGASLAIAGAPLRIRASAALSLAMALQELASNARRFGAWSTGGHVALAWSAPDDKDGVFALSWTETGGPAAAEPDRRGFGLRLVQQSLRSAFGRDVTIAFEPGGLQVTARAPLAAVAFGDDDPHERA